MNFYIWIINKIVDILKNIKNCVMQKRVGGAINVLVKEKYLSRNSFRWSYEGMLFSTLLFISETLMWYEYNNL